MSEQYSFQTLQKFRLFSVYPTKQLDIKKYQGVLNEYIEFNFGNLSSTGRSISLGGPNHTFLDKSGINPGWIYTRCHSCGLVSRHPTKRQLISGVDS